MVYICHLINIIRLNFIRLLNIDLWFIHVYVYIFNFSENYKIKLYRLKFITNLNLLYKYKFIFLAFLESSILFDNLLYDFSTLNIV